MLTNGVCLSFNKTGELLFLPIEIHINESSTENIPSFAEVSNISGVHINIDTSKHKVINVHMQDRHIIHLRAFAEGMFCTNLDDTGMVTNTTNTSVNPYYFLSTAKNSNIFTDSEVEGAIKV